jgi:hypothetical protein
MWCTLAVNVTGHDRSQQAGSLFQGLFQRAKLLPISYGSCDHDNEFRSSREWLHGKYREGFQPWIATDAGQASIQSAPHGFAVLLGAALVRTAVFPLFFPLRKMRRKPVVRAEFCAEWMDILSRTSIR